MKKEAAVLLAAALLVLTVTGCGADTAEASAVTTQTSSVSADENNSSITISDKGEYKTDNFNVIPDELYEIPEEYYQPAEKGGTLTELYYETYESFSYDEKKEKLGKRAIVYLPCGYSEQQRYDVFYLMHGGWSDETGMLGTPGSESEFKNVIDHAIENGEVRPMIVVCPTYNNTNENGRDSDSFSLAMRLTENYHNELLNDLIPAVESTYSTYAEGVTAEELAASKDHRGFGGFSMGSVTTWRSFEYCFDYFRYYLPMSCGTSLDDEEIWKSAEEAAPNSFFVYIMTGTSDFAYSYVERRVEKMRSTDIFTESNSERNGNFAYRVKEGDSHDGLAAMEYTYNGMRFFWGGNVGKEPVRETAKTGNYYTADTKIDDVINDPVFGEYGRLIFPVNDVYYSGSTLGDLSLTWYSNIQPDTTVEISNYLRTQAESGNTVFYDIYTDEEKAADPAKADTGLFFFKGEPGSKFAVCNAGGGFAYVGAMHDSFPHALELSKRGYNAFAIIYRPGAQSACEDLARAVAFIFENADELEVDTDDYSLWGGSAGGRMTAWLGSYGTENFGEKEYPRPAAVIIQYTGLSEVTGTEPPTYSCVGTRDGIADYRTMENRISAINLNGTDAEIEVFEGLPHGFGLGTGTAAEGWLGRAVLFWERNMD